MDSGHSGKHDALPKTSAAVVKTMPIVDNLDTLFPMLERGNFVTDPTVLAATWSDGAIVFAGETHQQELRGQSVHALTPDGHGGALAIVDGTQFANAVPWAHGTRLQPTIVLSPAV